MMEEPADMPMDECVEETEPSKRTCSRNGIHLCTQSLAFITTVIQERACLQ